MATPDSVEVQIDFFSTPLTATYSWIDVSSYVLAWDTQRGRQDELDRIEAGTARVTLDNSTRVFDPTYTAGFWYGNLLPMRRIRIRAIHGGITRYLFTGFIEAWPPNNPGGLNATVTLRCVDAFKLLAMRKFYTYEVLHEWPLIAGVQNVGVGSMLYAFPRFIYEVQGTVAGMTGTVTVNGVALGGGPASASFTLNGTAVVGDNSGGTRFGTPTSIDLPAQTAPGQAVTVRATTRYAAEQSNYFIETALNNAGWPSTFRTIYSGQTFIPYTIFSDGTSALSIVQQVAEAENGQVLIDGEGKFVFYNRHYRLQDSGSTTSQATFGDDPGDQFQYVRAPFSYDDTRIYNDVTVQRSGGVAQNATSSASINSYGQRTLAKTNQLIATDNEALNAAQWLLYIYKEPAVRFPRMELRSQLEAAGAEWQYALGLEIGDRITVKQRPAGGGNVISQDCHIEAISHRFDGKLWETTWQLSPASTTAWFVLDSATLGILDTDALAY